MARGRQQSILVILERLDNALTVDVIVDVFSAFVADYGFTSWAIAQFANPARIPLEKRISLSTWPDAYRDHRSRQPDEIHDPIVREAIRTNKPFRWRDAYKRANQRGRDMMDFARSFDLRDGIVFPMKPVDSYPGGVSLAGDTQLLDSTAVGELHLVSVHAYDRLERIAGHEPFTITVNLSPRETEVLHWAAAGKSNRDIADILVLSSKTIEHYASSVRRKLNACNMTQAVSNAICQGLIIP